MDVKLEQLIEKIKNEGVLEAQKNSEEIKTKAKNDAQALIDDAHKKADEIRKKTEKEAEQFTRSSQAALKQASRDLALSVREQLIKLCDTVFQHEISKTLTPDLLKEMIVKIVDKWPAKEGQTMEVLLSKEDRKKVEELILARVKDKAKNRIVIKTSPAVDKGFRISVEGENTYYDFSDESILEAIKDLVNPVLAHIISEDDG